MKSRLLDQLRCPECRAALALHDPVVEDGPLGPPEIVTVLLACTSCMRQYAIRGGIPRLAAVDLVPAASVTHKTASSFGFLWAGSDDDEEAVGRGPYHFAKMAESLGLEPPSGVILDACFSGSVPVLQWVARQRSYHVRKSL